MSGRASIVGAAVTHVGRVREHNEDAHYFDAEDGVFLVCDGMGGHAAGEVASAIAISTIRTAWGNDATHAAIDGFLEVGTPEAKKQLLAVLREGVVAAHEAIIAEATRDTAKSGMGTTLVGAVVVGGEVFFAHAGDSRAYLVRDHIAMQLTEDHTLLSRLLAAGIDVDLTGDGSRFKSMLTNALGIGAECRVSTFVVPLADGDRFLLCSDGVSEYAKEAEVGEILAKSPSPSRAAQKLVDLALERGGGDNATALVVRVLEAGESPLPVERRRRDDDVIAACPLWGLRVNPQQRLRALRIAIPREYTAGEKLPAQTLGDRVAWILLEGEVVQEGKPGGPASLIYPEALIIQATLPDKDGLAIAMTDIRALAIRADDFKEICDEDVELGEALLEALVNVISRRQPRSPSRDPRARAKTDPGIVEQDGETTAILGPPTGPQRSASDDSSDSNDATTELPAIGRSDTQPLINFNATDARKLPLSPDELLPENAPVLSPMARGRATPAGANDEETTLTRDKATGASERTEEMTRPETTTRGRPVRDDGGSALRALWGEQTGEKTIEKPIARTVEDPDRRHSEPDMPTVIIMMEDPTPPPAPPPAPPVDPVPAKPIPSIVRPAMAIPSLPKRAPTEPGDKK